MKFAISIYKLQTAEGRFFLHEHPHGAHMWDDERMIKLQSAQGVFTVIGPVCHRNMDVRDKHSNFGTPRQRTKWVTIGPELARTWPELQMFGVVMS